MGPAPVVAEVRRAVRAALRTRPRPGVPVLVCCSGGADSVALAAAAAFEAPRAGVPAGLITVDHGLQVGSAGRAAAVAALGHELGLDPVLLAPVTVGAHGGPEAAARAARYAALDAAATTHGADLLLAHTADDQAETVLLGLGRGSGPRSVAGMRPVDGHRLRPLLATRRATTRAACQALGLPVWDDPHNADARFRRVRVRHELLPLLDDVLAGGVVEALARTADQQQDLLDALAVLAPDLGGDPDLRRLAAQPRAVRRHLLRAWTADHGVPALSAVHTEALDGLVTDWHGQGPIDLPGGFAAFRASGRLGLRRPPG